MAVIGFVAAAWCLAFAAVNARQLWVGPPDRPELRGWATALVVASVLVLALKVLAAVIALASLGSVSHGRSRWLLGMALWVATSTLAVYAGGSVLLALGTVAGLLEPTDAWRSAGGVTPRAVAYVLFFVAGASLFAVLATSYHRRHGLSWSAVAVGLVVAPALLGGLLLALPALLSSV